MSHSDPPHPADPAHSVRKVSWCFFVLAGLDVAAALMFSSFAQHIRDDAGPSELAAEPGQLMNLAIAFCMLMLAVNAVFALLHVLTAIHLRQHRSRRLGIVVSMLSCLQLPFGTIAGVYALITLRKAPIKALFAPTQ